jgi:predicted DNA-binding protein (UPF0251 family)
LATIKGGCQNADKRQNRSAGDGLSDNADSGGVYELPRPRKWRKVCSLPQTDLFGPLDIQASESDPIIMTVDEYETIRLIDMEGMVQEECAEKMNVARTTVQRIYNDARRKLAELLVDGRILKIEGGDYELCDRYERPHGCRRCYRHRHGKELE